MEILEIMKQRHSVRQYEERAIEEEVREQLNDKIFQLNKESGLNIQIFYDEPKCFDSMMAHYGKFRGVRNYISLVGKKNKNLEEQTGYYGEQIVLFAQELGLNTCWVAMTHGRSRSVINKGEKETCLISIGYGVNQGVEHKIKKLDEVKVSDSDRADWFDAGVKAALLAPTAMNQQKFVFELKNGEVSVKVAGKGFYTKLDLGIVKYHFEAVTGRKIK